MYRTDSVIEQVKYLVRYAILTRLVSEVSWAVFRSLLAKSLRDLLEC